MKMLKFMSATALVAIFLAVFPLLAGALSPEQVIALKKAGVGEETIRLMIQQEREAQQANPYDTLGRKEIKDGRGDTIIIYSTGRGTIQDKDREEKEKADKAWKMLQNMVIDGRTK